MYAPEFGGVITKKVASKLATSRIEEQVRNIGKQDAICQGYFHPRVRKSKSNALALLISERIRSARALKYTAL